MNGLIILGLIIVPLFILMIASVFESPRSPRVAAMFTTILKQIETLISGQRKDGGCKAQAGAFTVDLL